MAGEPGLGLACCEWLHGREVAVVASDNWAIEVLPGEADTELLPVHMVLIRDMGMTLGEILDLDELAADCEADGVWEFPLTAPPIKFSAAVGSPRCVTPVNTQGPKPVRAMPGEMLISALITPLETQLTAVPARIPLGPRSRKGGVAVACTMTVAKPEAPPTVARTVFEKVPVVGPATNTPVTPIPGRLSITPASAGPRMRQALLKLVFSEMALRSRAGPTRSG